MGKMKQLYTEQCEYILDSLKPGQFFPPSHEEVARILGQVPQKPGRGIAAREDQTNMPF
jgi:hypothetical protein